MNKEIEIGSSVEIKDGKRKRAGETGEIKNIGRDYRLNDLVYFVEFSDGEVFQYLKGELSKK